jgi:3-oxoacyl-[acyl-carrier-protein] synthase II
VRHAPEVRRVVVTGLGVLAPTGKGVEEFWDSLEEGRSGAKLIEFPGVAPAVLCPIEGFEPETWFSRRDARRMDRCGQLAAAAALLALEDAGGDLGLPEGRVGASVGSAHGGAQTLSDAYQAYYERGADRVSPFAIPLSLTNVAAASTARALGLRGPSAAPCTACAAGADAIGAALALIREDRADAMFAGGADAPLAPVIVAGYRSLGALSSISREPEQASRPFDRDRDGFVMAEGAGILVLEEREHAIRRGARIYAELGGYGSSCDAAHLTDPDQTGEGPAVAIRQALVDAGVAPEEIGYVNAHATSTSAGDTAEARAIVLAGLGHALVSSTKAMHGHTMGAAGGVEAIAALMPIVRGMTPPSVNLDAPDDEIELDFVVDGARAIQTDATLSNSFGFGGHNAAIVLRRHSTG